MRPRDPEAALEAATTTLNSKNLDALWCLSSLLSCEESLERPASWDPPPLFPVLNHEKVRLLCEAILASKAASYKTDRPTRTQLVRVINHCNDLLGDPDFPARLEQAKQDGTVAEELLRHFAWLGNVQMRVQNPRHGQRIGQIFAMFVALPAQYPDLVPFEKRELVERMVAAIPVALGAELRELWVCWLLLRSLCQRRSASFSEQLRSRYQALSSRRRPLESDKDLQFRLFKRVLEPDVQKLAIDRMKLKLDLSGDVGRLVTESEVKAFFDLLARSTKDLRRLRSTQRQYSVGLLGSRLSILERYPVVRLDDSHVVVPNLRFYDRNFPDILHYSLLDSLGDDYSQARGVLQEVFLRALVSERLPGVDVIEERPYRRGSEEVRGPDLTLIEGDRLIVVESKARRIRVETRFTMTPEAIRKNLDDVVRQVVGLGRKVEDMRAGLTEYQDVQPLVDRTEGTEAIRVAVVGEEFTFMGDIVRQVLTSDEKSLLRDVVDPYCVVGLGTFERAVELAAQHSTPLHEVLRRHWEASSTIDPSTPSADEFPGLPDLTRATFSQSFLPKLDATTEMPPV